MTTATPEHRAEIHSLVSHLKKSGKPVWPYKLTVSMPEDAPFEENRDAFANALQNSKWFRDKGQDDSPLWWLWDEIKDADDVDHFDLVLGAIYDEADYDRVWIEIKHEEAPL